MCGLETFKLHPILHQDFQSILPYIDLDKLRCSTISITGAAGFIGSYVFQFLKWLNVEHDARMDINGFDNYAHPSQPYAGQILKQDICHLTADWAVKLQRSDYILNLASIAAPEFYLKHPKETIKVNLLGTLNVMEAATPPFGAPTVQAIAHASSVEIYGEPAAIPTPEDYCGNISPVDKRSVYSESKRAGETIAMAYFREDGLPVVILRPFNVYGPGETLNDGRVVPNLINALLGKSIFKIYSSTATRSYCYISDAVIQILGALLRGTPGEVYNVGDENSEITLVELAAAAERGTGRNVNSELQENHDGAPSKRRPDCRKIREIAEPPVVTLEEGLRRTFAYYAD